MKLFESENKLKCKNRLHDFIEILCLIQTFEKIILDTLQWLYKDLIILLNCVYFKENYMAKSLRIFSGFMTAGPDV